MTDKTVSIYWFFILFIVASAIVFIVFSLYGKPLDVRQMEGIFLAEKVADCVSQGGKISPEGERLMKREDILKVCHLNFAVEPFKEYWNNDQLYVALEFFDGGQTSISSVYGGNENLKVNNNLNFIEPNKKNLPFCVQRIIFSNGEEGKYYSIKIFTCVGKKGKNA